jgi:hypothetical protein
MIEEALVGSKGKKQLAATYLGGFPLFIEATDKSSELMCATDPYNLSMWAKSHVGEQLKTCNKLLDLATWGEGATKRLLIKIFLFTNLPFHLSCK